jgi:hypothetical protein
VLKDALQIFVNGLLSRKEINMTTTAAANVIPAFLGDNFADGIRVSFSAFHFSCIAFPGF